MLWISVVHYFSLLGSVSLNEYIRFICTFTDEGTFRWYYFLLLLLLIKMLQVFVNKYLYGHTLLFPLGKYFKSGISVSSKYIFTFKKLPNCFPKCSEHFALAWEIYKTFIWSIFSLKLGLLSLFNFSHSRGYIVVSHCGLICISLMTFDIFMCLFDIVIPPFIRHLPIQKFCLIKNIVIYVFIIEYSVCSKYIF